MFFFFCRLLIFLKIKFFKKNFGNNIRVSNSLDPDQAQNFVDPDLGTNGLQRSSADSNGEKKEAQSSRAKI